MDEGRGSRGGQDRRLACPQKAAGTLSFCHEEGVIYWGGVSQLNGGRPLNSYFPLTCHKPQATLRYQNLVGTCLQLESFQKLVTCKIAQMIIFFAEKFDTAPTPPHVRASTQTFPPKIQKIINICSVNMTAGRRRFPRVPKKTTTTEQHSRFTKIPTKEEVSAGFKFYPALKEISFSVEFCPPRVFNITYKISAITEVIIDPHLEAKWHNK